MVCLHFVILSTLTTCFPMCSAISCSVNMVISFFSAFHTGFCQDQWPVNRSFGPWSSICDTDNSMGWLKMFVITGNIRKPRIFNNNYAVFPVAFWPFQKSNEQSILVPGIPGPQDVPSNLRLVPLHLLTTSPGKNLGKPKLASLGFDLDPSLIYPLVNSHIAIENGPVETVDLPIKHGDFP